jgi:hypothetical protein
VGEGANQPGAQLQRQVEVTKQVGRLDTPRSDFDRQAQTVGLIANLANFGCVKFVERQIVSELHDANLELGGPFQQVPQGKGLARRLEAGDTKRPWI